MILIYLYLYGRCSAVALGLFWKPLPELLALYVTHLHGCHGQAKSSGGHLLPHLCYALRFCASLGKSLNLISRLNFDLLMEVL